MKMKLGVKLELTATRGRLQDEVFRPIVGS